MGKAQVTQMDKATAKMLVDETRAALQTIAARYGLDVEAGGGKYDSIEGTFSPKIEFRIGGAEQERRVFDANARLFDLKPEHYGRRFTVRGTEYALIGFAVGRSKFCLKGRAVKSDKVMLFTETVLTQIDGRKRDSYSDFLASA